MLLRFETHGLLFSATVVYAGLNLVCVTIDGADGDGYISFFATVQPELIRLLGSLPQRGSQEWIEAEALVKAMVPEEVVRLIFMSGKSE